jgi:hypothetical protein
MTERNQLCPCGSGLKYKKCCVEKEATTKVPRGVLILVGAIALIAALGFVPSLLDNDAATTPASAARASAATPLAAQGAASPGLATPAKPGSDAPPGAAPAGKVWSKEHGHWHDANAKQQSPIQMDTSQLASRGTSGRTAPAPTPNGAAPAGMIWSAEHQHWHKAPGAQGAPVAPAAAAPIAVAGPASAPGAPGAVRVMGQTVDLGDPAAVAAASTGRIWSAEHGHYHEIGKPHATATPVPAGVTPTPRATAAPATTTAPENP